MWLSKRPCCRREERQQPHADLALSPRNNGDFHRVPAGGVAFPTHRDADLADPSDESLLQPGVLSAIEQLPMDPLILTRSSRLPTPTLVPPAGARGVIWLFGIDPGAHVGAAGCSRRGAGGHPFHGEAIAGRRRESPRGGSKSTSSPESDAPTSVPPFCRWK